MKKAAWNHRVITIAIILIALLLSLLLLKRPIAFDRFLKNTEIHFISMQHERIIPGEPVSQVSNYLTNDKSECEAIYKTLSDFLYTKKLILLNGNAVAARADQRDEIAICIATDKNDLVTFRMDNIGNIRISGSIRENYKDYAIVAVMKQERMLYDRLVELENRLVNKK